MTRDPSASLTLARFLAPVRSLPADFLAGAARARSHVAAPDPLRGDPLSPAVVALVDLIRPKTARALDAYMATWRASGGAT